MKVLLSVWLIVLANRCLAQSRAVDFNIIDRNVQYIEAAAPDTLAQRLTMPYKTDLEKVRSIFRWITEHISYKVKDYTYGPVAAKYNHAATDTATDGKPLNERVAIHVLKKGVAFCDGYARLFKTLCDDAGIRCEIIIGYARSEINTPGKFFRANHTWNAVYFDSAWHLLDVTWASGYVNYWGTEFIKAYDDHYFLTPPPIFLRDHYPENLQWTLLADPPPVEEFYYSPFKYSGFIKSHIVSYKPANGIIEASVGDSLKVEVETADTQKRLLIVDTPDVDSALLTDSASLVLPMAITTGKTISYTYKVASDAAQWLNVIYNDEVIMRYKLNVRKNQKEEK